MKLFVVSDIHGYAELLKEALKKAGYDPKDNHHLLICCGDLFDRGTENMEVLKFFENIERKVMIKGNHEERLLEILDTGRLGQHDAMNGTIETIHEFFGKYSVLNLYDPVDFSGKTSMIRRLFDLIGEMRDYYETEQYIFVHGWLPNEGGTVLSGWRNASEQQWSTGRWTWWIKGCEMPCNKEHKTIVCGHYPTMDSEIYHGDGFIAIDAGTDTRKKVNVLVIDDNLLKEKSELSEIQDLEIGHFERISAQCKYQYKNERGRTRLTRYILEADDKLTVLVDKDTGIYKEIIDRDGTFTAFPGIEYCDELLESFEYPAIEHRVKYGAYIVKIHDGRYLFQWIIQPYRFDPGDEWGFGMEEQPEIRLYSHIDRQGNFTEPFRLYSISNRGYYQGPEEEAKVIFLDFDGVLNSRNYIASHPNSGVAIDPTRLALLREIVFKTDAKIVLSTSWREHWNIISWLCDETGKEINRIFAESNLYVYDKTPDLNRNRYEEIATWLKQHPQIKNFVVLDDEPFEEDVFRDHFVLTSRLRNGIDKNNTETAIKILNGDD